ncbi:Ca(2)-dependent phospholipid-binding protein (Copine) family [Striga hermonthica]|uniref:Ca(2)-dependent phospholipid-binding protein (Copine) family n=1 Tax=Striga hermonthica TaxID=68872 RepID=A0A9N7MUV3_STRHE|nr:Ca(2)-dependent phospholipid-binding protein (Copine) family [Striga hermonthica]
MASRRWRWVTPGYARNLKLEPAATNGGERKIDGSRFDERPRLFGDLSSSSTGARDSGAAGSVSRASSSSLLSSSFHKSTGGGAGGMPSSSSGADKRKKYGYIPDTFTSIDQVTAALRESGLESSNLIIGIDFTKSNEWTGKVSFNNRSLHAVGDVPNPYEKAIAIIGKTLAPFDEDNLIPCFGFGDATTHDQEVFSFHNDHSPCNGFEEVLACYKRIVPNLRLSGPTSYGPVVDAAVDIVERNGGQYHVLVIIADGQVSRTVNTNEEELSTQEEKTINSIVNASFYPLSIILVGVGDGPWEDMKKFDDKIPAREFDNFQFVNFTAIMSKNSSPSGRETAFALAALMEIPIQYKATKEFGILGRVTGKAKKVVPRPPPVLSTRQTGFPAREPSTGSAMQDDQNQVCPVCLTNGKDMAFGCGHMTCRDCSIRLSDCPVCRRPITSRLRLYT